MTTTATITNWADPQTIESVYGCAAYDSNEMNGAIEAREVVCYALYALTVLNDFAAPEEDIAEITDELQMLDDHMDVLHSMDDDGIDVSDTAEYIARLPR